MYLDGVNSNYAPESITEYGANFIFFQIEGIKKHPNLPLSLINHHGFRFHRVLDNVL
jgi:hypothetical protein